MNQLEWPGGNARPLEFPAPIPIRLAPRIFPEFFPTRSWRVDSIPDVERSMGAQGVGPAEAWLRSATSGAGGGDYRPSVAVWACSTFARTSPRYSVVPVSVTGWFRNGSRFKGGTGTT